jgi:hypothetical protein
VETDAAAKPKLWGKRLACLAVEAVTRYIEDDRKIAHEL